MKQIVRRFGLLILLGILVFALPTWWMRVWLPYQGTLPTPTPSPTASALDTAYRQAVELAATDPLAALPLFTELAFSDNPHAAAAFGIRQGIQTGRVSEDPAYLLTATGQALAAAGEWAAARQAFLGAVELNPNYAEAWAFLGEALQQNGQDGLPALLRAINLDTSSLSAHLFLTLYWQRQGDFQQAARQLQMTALYYPESSLIQMQLGENEVKAGHSPAALPYFERALELAPDDPATWRSLAVYSVENALYLEEVGLPAIEKLLDDAGEQAELLLLKARAFVLLRRDTDAEEFFNLALLADEAHAPAHLYYGIYLLSRQRLEPARQHLNQVLALAPQGPQADLAAHWLAQISQ